MIFYLTVVDFKSGKQTDNDGLDSENTTTTWKVKNSFESMS